MKALIVYKTDKPNVVDRFPKDTQIDYLDINTPFEVKVKDYSVVYCDCLEAYEPRVVPDTIKRLYDCVAIKGELWISTNSFEFSANQAFVDVPHPAFHWALFGNSDSPHRSAFTLRWLRELVENVGLIMREAHQEKLIISNKGHELEVPINFIVGWKYEIANPAESIQ